MNAIEHAYGPGDAEIVVHGELQGGVIGIDVRDKGSWRDPGRDGRGRGEGIMASLMEVTYDRGAHGSTVHLRRRLRGGLSA